MATTSLWRITGRIERVVDYAENSEKTTVKNETEADDLGKVISYAERDEATNTRQLISVFNCNPDDPVKTMNNTKRKYGKTGGTIAYHGYQSFAEGEVTPDEAHKIGRRLAEELWADRYEVVVCTHVDKASHIHNHFVINTVSFVDGIKFHRTKQDYLKMQKVSDRLCWEQGLSVIEEHEGKRKNYGEWSAERNGKPTYRSMVRRDIDAAIKMSLTEKEFFRNLKELGYELKLYGNSGKPLSRPSLRPRSGTRYFRFDRLGDDYSLDEIKYRILENIKRNAPFPEAERNEYYTYRRKNPPKTKHTGFAALYYHYCYELHIITKYPASVKQVSFFMREDLRKLEKLDEQTRFLGKNNISTIDDLNAYRKDTSDRIRLLEWERQVQRNILKAEVRREDVPAQNETKTKISGITGELNKLKKNLQICDSVEERSSRMKQELEALRMEIRKGERTDELFRGSSGTDRPYVTKRS